MKAKRPSLWLISFIAIACCPLGHAVPISWTTGTTGDAAGAWSGSASTFNGQAYTTADDLTIDGSASKVITLTGTVPTPNSLTVSSTGNVQLTGTSLGGTLSKTGSAVLTLSSANTFGAMSISGGKLILGNQNALGTTGTLTANTGTAVRSATSSYAAGNAAEFFFDTTGVATSGTYQKSIAITPTTGTYGFVMTGGAALTNTLSGNITGASGVTLWMDTNGSGDSTSVWALTGDNSGFAGTIRLNRGVLSLSNANAGGTGTIFLQSNANANGNLVFTNSFTLGTAITFGTTAGDVISTGANDNTLSGTITSGVAWTKAGTGKLTLTNATNATTGAITVAAGTLAIGGAGRINSGTSAAGIVLNSATSTFDYGSTAAQTISGAITGTGKLIKSGSGTLSLTGTGNTFSGGTSITNGTLSINAAGSIGTGTITASASYGTGYSSGGTPFLFVNNNTATVLSNAITLASPGSAQYYAIQKSNAATPVATSTLELSGVISGGSATSVLQLDSNVGGDSQTGFIISGTSNTLNGQIRLNRGTLTLTNANAAGNASLFIQTNANASGNLIFSNSFTLANSVTIGANANNVISTGANNNTLSGTLTSGSAWAKNGSGTLTLSNTTNAITAATTVTNGTLAIGGSGRLNSGTSTAGIVLTAATSTFDYGSSATQSVSGISGSGKVVMSGSGALTLSGSNSYSGGTTVSAGTLTAGSTSAFGSGAITVTGGTLALGSQNIGNSAISLNGGTVTGSAYTGAVNVGAASSTIAGTFNGVVGLNNYATSVSGRAGTLQAGTSSTTAINTTGNLSVGNLQGQGTFSGGLVTVTGSQMTSTAPGTQTFNNGLAYSSGSTITLGIAADGSGSDLLQVNNGLTIDASVSLAVTLFGSANYGDAYWDTDHSFTLINAANGTTGTFSSFDTSGLGDTTGQGIWSIDQTSGGVTANWMAVPEPSSFFLASIAGVGLMLRRRRSL